MTALNRQIWTFTVIALLAMFIGSGCAKKQTTWYQQGKGQVDYDRDAQECAIIAGNFAKQATVTGDSEDPEVYRQTLLNCLTGKGWSGSAPTTKGSIEGKDQLRAESEPLAMIDGTTIFAFGSAIKLPPRFHFTGAGMLGAGPSRAQTASFSGPHDTFVTIMAQRVDGTENRFVPTPYPVKAPFFLYDQATSRDSAGGDNNWSVFCGTINGEWVMGVGGFLLINPQERVTVIVTKPLIPQQTEPQAEFRLSAEQFPVVDAFREEWRTWLSHHIVMPQRSWWSRFLSPTR